MIFYILTSNKIHRFYNKFLDAPYKTKTREYQCLFAPAAPLRPYLRLALHKRLAYIERLGHNMRMDISVAFCSYANLI